MEFLLMGGQACILYGAAEFSRDLDITIRIGEDNFDRLQSALTDLDAEPIYVPPLSREALERGHSCHFRCRVPEASGIRIDVMARQRGVSAWDSLWPRRIELHVPEVGIVPVMGLKDLVRAKKTQRDKDWPMIRRLIEADVQTHVEDADLDRVRFWLEECRTPQVLADLVMNHPELAAELASDRQAIGDALGGDLDAVRKALQVEEERERQVDRDYWKPLREELERMRHEARRPK